MRSFLNICFPRHCLFCGLRSKTDLMVCETCYETLPFSPKHTALSEQIPVYTLFQYESPISDLIKQLKFHENLMVAHFFAECWIKFFKENESLLPDCFIPMPLHKKRLQSRGFNQALEITKPIANYFNIPIDKKSCVRIKNTKPQSELSALDREKNMKNAFQCHYQVPPKHVSIIDDVITTGTTLITLIDLLKAQGVDSITVFCCATVDV